MNVQKAGIPITDFTKVWCEDCCIRIDPHEERSGVGGKTYHPYCYSKLVPANPTTPAMIMP
jgi:hypothetical protein